MVGSVIENYKIVSVLGEGGMGIVYKGFDLKLERFIALKILNQQALKNPQFIERFKREAKNQAKLNHTNIVPVYGFTEYNGLLGIVMEYVAGETLERLIARKGRLELQESVNILRQVLEGAAYAHSKGFVHRDLKPSNIIISQEGVAKIMDFGISKSVNEVRGITKTGTKLGTVLYMSPEQIKAQEPTLQSDIYSLGITFYEMLSGKTPFEAPTDFHIMEGHLKKNPIKITSQFDYIPPVVDTILSKALSKSTARRYHSCEEFLADINSIPLTPYKAKKTKKITEHKKFDFTSEDFLRKLKNYSLIAFIIFAFATLFFYVYQSVSEFWIVKYHNSSKLIDNGGDSYRSNPSYLTRSSWKSITCPVTTDLNSVTFLNDSVGFACGTNSTILKSVDGGNKWEVIPVGDSAVSFYDIKFFNSNSGIIAGEKGTILLTEDGGKTWHKVTTDVYESLFGIYILPNSNTGFIAGGSGIILKSTNTGNTWQRVLSPSRNLLYSIAFAGSTLGYAVGWNGELLKTTNQGNSWAMTNRLSDSYFRDISFADKDIGIIVGGGGEIYRTDDGGSDWEKISAQTISGLYSVSFLDNKNGIILGSKGEIFITDDAGKSWKASASGKFGALTHLSVLPSNKIVIVGSNGTILMSQ